MYNSSTGSVEIKGGIISASAPAAYSISYGVYNGSTGTLTIGINDNEVNSIEPIVPLIESQMYGVYNNIGILNIYDGKIKGTIGKTIAGTITEIEEGYEIVKTEEDETEVMTLGLLQNEQTQDSVVSVKVGETTKYYQSLIYGISTVGEGQATITMLKNTQEKVSISSNKNIILDLNGKEISLNADTPVVINNYGIVEIIDSAETGIIKAIANRGNSYGLCNYGTGSITISGGTIRAISNSNVDSSYGVYNASTGNITISGGMISVSSGGSTMEGSYGVYNGSTGNIVISGGEISGTANYSYNYGVYNSAGGSIEITGGIIGGYTGIYNKSTGNVRINGGTINIIAKNSGYGVYNGSGTIIVDKGTINVSTTSIYDSIYGLYNGTGNIEISGGIIRASTSSSYATSYGMYNNSTGIVTIGINDSEVKVIEPVIESQMYGVYNKGILNIYDGKIKGSIGDTIVGVITQAEEGYELVKIEEEGKEIATLGLLQNEQTEDSVVSVRIGETTKYYQTLIYGISTVGEEQATITMLKNTKESVSILSTKNIILDLNGKEISAAGKNISVITNYGILEIIDSEGGGILNARTNSSNSSCYGVCNYTTGSITITRVSISLINTSMNGSNYTYGVCNNGTGSITITEATISATSSNSSYGVYNDGTGSIIITGGTISAISNSNYSYGVRNQNTGSVIINGGIINATSTSYYSYGVYNNTTGNITIGTKGDPTTEETPSITATTNSTSTSYKAYGIYKYNANGKINFYDGTIKAQIAKYGEFTEVEEGYEYVITVIDELENLVLQQITP